jgi:F420 biosynthesis protein FbiB-like protein
MNTLDAIAARRSIRKFKADPVPADLLQTVLQAALQAPSGKNKQPWRWVVVSGERRNDLARCLRESLAKMKSRGQNTGSAEWSVKIMEQAPVTVFVFNPYGLSPWQSHSVEQMIDEVIDVQSVGAAIQNLLLAAQDRGLGSLWICDVFYAYEELCGWLGEQGQMVAAVALGYADEGPAARPRKPASDVVRWL